MHQDLYNRLCGVRGHPQQFLAGLGAMVAALTFASGALRNAIVTWQATGGGESRIERQARFDLPLEYVVVYGLFFSALVALIYVPVYGSLESAGMDLVDKVYPVPDDEAPSEDWQGGASAWPSSCSSASEPTTAFVRASPSSPHFWPPWSPPFCPAPREVRAAAAPADRDSNGCK